MVKVVRKRLLVNPRRRVKRRNLRRRHRRRSNPAQIITLGLAGGNPVRRRRHFRRNARRRVRRLAPRLVTVRVNPRIRVRYRRRRNPNGLQHTASIAAWTLLGAIATRALTQAVLGSRNVGFMGYVGNAVSALGLGWVTAKTMKRRDYGDAVAIGGFVALLLRVIQELTPFGRYVTLQLRGMGVRGDVGLGMLLPKAFVQPEIYTGQGAQVYVPTGWGAPAAQTTTASKPLGRGW